MDISPFTWDEVDSAPDSPGLYAWYHRISFSEPDLATVRERLSSADEIEAWEAVQGFLSEMLLEPHRESPYRVTIQGSLKPRYVGLANHEQSLASTQLSGLAAVGAVEHLARVLELSTPYFSSPIYIGVAKRSLRGRLKQHVRDIEKFRSRSIENLQSEVPVKHRLGYEVALRGILPNELLVYTMSLESAEGVAGAAEYLLNRINYPLCGRN